MLLLRLPGRNPAVPWLAVALMLITVTVLITRMINLPLNAAIHDVAPAFVEARQPPVPLRGPLGALERRASRDLGRLARRPVLGPGRRRPFGIVTPPTNPPPTNEKEPR